MIDFLWKNFFKKEKQAEEIKNLLKKNFLFEGMNNLEFGQFLKICQLRKFQPSEVIFRQGEAGSGFYVILKGKVHITLESLPGQGKQMRKTHLVELKKGDFFGEAALFHSFDRREATATAEEETFLIGFFRTPVNEFMKRAPKTGLKFLYQLNAVLSQRLNYSNKKFSELERKIESFE